PVPERPVARGLPGVPGAGGGADGARADAVLAVRAVAALPVGELAAAAPAGLPALRRPAVLVPLPEVGRVPAVRNANEVNLAGAAEAGQKGGKAAREMPNRADSCRFTGSEAWFSPARCVFVGVRAPPSQSAEQAVGLRVTGVGPRRRVQA